MKRVLSLIFLFLTLVLNSQKVFLDEFKSTAVDSIDAKYYVVSDFDSNPRAYKETVFLMNGEKVSETSYTKSSTHFVKNGKLLGWYKNGQLEKELNYIDGKLDGKGYYWYENGQLKREVNYSKDKVQSKAIEWFETGQVKSEGGYSNSQLDGILLTYWGNGRLKRKDLFNNGKFQNGTCYDSLGNEVEHFDYEVMPMYKGGERRLLNYIASELKYPERSRDAGIQGKVVVRFAVNEDGSISDVEVLQGINPELNLEAIRVIRKLKKFTPGYRDGEPAQVYYMVPIGFSLN